MRIRTGFTIVELVVAMALLSGLSLILLATLQHVSRVAVRTSSRDECLGQILKAKAALLRDLANSSGRPGHFASAKVGPSVGAGFDGDALTFLSSDDGSNTSHWDVDINSARAALACQITYYLVIPNAAVSNKWGVSPVAAASDSAGYEQQFPAKWLIRRVDPITAPGPLIDPVWPTWLTRPSARLNTPTVTIVSDRLFQFRVLQTAPVWTLQIRGVAVQDAAKKIAMGSVPLSASPYTVTQQFSIPANN